MTELELGMHPLALGARLLPGLLSHVLEPLCSIPVPDFRFQGFRCGVHGADTLASRADFWLERVRLQNLILGLE
jgi:hypothetical protein